MNLKPEFIPTNTSTWEDAFRHYWPKITLAKINYLLWNETCYPFGGKEMVLKNIHELYTKSKKK